MGRYLHVGPFPSPGSVTTVDVAYWSPAQPFTSLYGVGYRQVIDLGDLSHSLYVPPPPGQSEIPSSPHYKDLAATWANGYYATMLWTRAQVDADASTILTLLTR
jgi:penicillin amidase